MKLVSKRTVGKVGCKVVMQTFFAIFYSCHVTQKLVTRFRQKQFETSINADVIFKYLKPFDYRSIINNILFHL